ncbi:MAG: regulatory protein TetR [Nocardioides sp.]|nr:regulatory protein TetR [Nocardioides sp.]
MTDSARPLSAKGTRLNRRGLETRRHLLKVALRCLADGGVDAVSANLVAREAGVTWGTVQHQFGDVDGLWAAVIDLIATNRGALGTRVPRHSDLAERVDAVVDMLWTALNSPASRAIYNLRSALPNKRADLEVSFPRTAAAIAAWEVDWTQIVDSAFDDLDVDPAKLARVRNMLPATLRGLYVEETLSTYMDLEEARRGLREAITAYLA